MSAKIMGFDAYNFNFFWLMLLTAIEVGVVAQSENMAWATLIFVLVSIGIVKFIGIAAVFMHLRFSPDSNVLTATALFPVIFIVLLVLMVGLTSPSAVENLPAFCRPGYYGL